MAFYSSLAHTLVHTGTWFTWFTWSWWSWWWQILQLWHQHPGRAYLQSCPVGVIFDPQVIFILPMCYHCYQLFNHLCHPCRPCNQSHHDNFPVEHLCHPRPEHSDWVHRGEHDDHAGGIVQGVPKIVLSDLQDLALFCTADCTSAHYCRITDGIQAGSHNQF